MRLTGKTALVTGGCRGIGRQICLKLAEQGVRLVIADIDPEGMRETARLAEERSGLDSLCHVTDLRDEAAIRELVKLALDRGKVDFLINNSGIAGPTANIEDVTLAEWNDCMSINMTGMFLLCKYLAPHMKTLGDARIVNMSSIAPKVPLPWRAPYCASKMAIIGFTRSLAKELGEFGIRVNAVSPGTVEGARQDRVIDEIARQSGRSRESVVASKVERIPLRAFISEASIADLVVFLCSPEGAMITGQDMNINGGAFMN